MPNLKWKIPRNDEYRIFFKNVPSADYNHSLAYWLTIFNYIHRLFNYIEHFYSYIQFNSSYLYCKKQCTNESIVLQIKIIYYVPNKKQPTTTIKTSNNNTCV